MLISVVVVFIASCALATQDLISTSPALDAALARQFIAYGTSQTIDARARTAVAKNNGKSAHVVIVQDGEGDIVASLPPGRQKPGISLEVSVGVGNADLIIEGIPLQRRSLPIPDRSFLYSQYAVRVAQVISPNAEVFPGDVILVARAGGTLWVENAFVRAIDPDLQLFRLNRPYYFFLRQVPGTDAYRALGSGTWAIEDGHVMPASEKAKKTPPQREIDFLKEIERSIAYRPWPRKERR